VIKYTAIRLCQGVLALLLISVVIFALSRATGDPSDVLLPLTADEELIQQYRQSLGLDRPIYVQYGIFARNLVLHGDLGESVRSRRPVTDVIGEHLPATLRLSVAAIMALLIFAVPLGLFSALYRGSIIDKILQVLAVSGIAVPHFWLGLLLLLVFSVELKWTPMLMNPGMGFKGYILPGITLATYPIAGLSRLSRSSILEVLDAEHVKFARSKGLRERAVIFKHVLRNAMIPVVTMAGMYFVMFIAGSVVVETVFSWPGIGRLTYIALTTRDLPLLQGCILMIAAIVVTGNFLVDISYGLIDPRVRMGRNKQ